MKLNCTLILCFLFVAFSAVAQVREQQEIYVPFGEPDSGIAEVAHKIIQTRDSNFVMAGGWNSAQAFLFKVDDCGDSIWIKQFKYGSKLNVFTDMLELPNGELIVAGYCEDCAIGDTTQKMMVIRTDSAGNVLAGPEYFGLPNRNAQCFSIAPTFDGGYILGGLTNRQGWFCTSAHLYKLNSAFALQWNQFYDARFCDGGRDAIQLADGGYVIGGHALTIYQPRQVQLWRTDAFGFELWRKALFTDTVGNLIQANKIIQSQNGDLIVTGTKYVDNLKKHDLFIARVDQANGDLLSYNEWGSDIEDLGFDIHELANGNFVVSGRWGRGLNLYGGRSAWVLLIDSAFNLIDEYKTSTFLFSQDPRSVVPLSKDGREFVFCGNRAFFWLHDAIFVRRSKIGHRANFTHFPLTRQLYARNVQVNRAPVRVIGSVPAADSTLVEMRLKIFRNNQWLQTLVEPLNYNGSDANFSFIYSMTAEPVNYRIEAWAFDGTEETLEARSCKVVAGDAFIIQGGSNALAPMQDGSTQNLESPFIRVYGASHPEYAIEEWKVAQGDGGILSNANTGQWGMKIASTILSEYNLPVAIFNGAQDESFVSIMRPDSVYAPDSSRYNRLLGRVLRSGMDQDVRGIFHFDGERQARKGFSTEAYNDYFDTLQLKWLTDYPKVEKIYKMQIRPGCELQHSNVMAIQEAQRQIALRYPAVELISTVGTSQSDDSCLFVYENGYELIADRILMQLRHDLYGGTDSENIRSPMIETAVWQDSNQVFLVTTDTNINFDWQQTIYHDFELFGDSIAISSVEVRSDTIFFSLDRVPDTLTAVSYGFHALTDTPAIVSGRNQGLVCFDHLPIVRISVPIDTTGPIDTTEPPDTTISSIQNGDADLYFSVQPNPFGAIVTIESMFDTYPVRFKLIDISGRFVATIELASSKQSENLGALSPGTYFLVPPRQRKTKPKRLLRY